MADTKISALPASTTLEDADKLALAQSLATTPATNAPTLLELKGYFHVGSGSLGYFDAEVDGTGTAPNTYSTIKAAVDAGKVRIKQTASTTESADITLSADTVVYVEGGVTVTWGTSRINMAGFSLFAVGLDRFDAIWNYTPTVAGNRFCYNTPLGSQFAVFENIKIQNLGSVANTSICEDNILIMENCTVIPGNADNAGANFNSINCYSDHLIVGSTPSSTDALVAAEGFHCDVRLTNGSLVSGNYVTIGENARVDNINVAGGNPTDITINGSVTSMTTRSTDVSVTVDEDNVSLFNCKMYGLTINATRSDVRVIGCDASNNFTDNGTDTVRSGNNSVIGNDYTP